jgi:hypothetical protein
MVAVPAAAPTMQTASGDGEPVERPGAKAAAPADPVEPATYRPVVRKGKPPNPSVRGGRGRFLTAPVTYPDGVSVTVTRTRSSAERGQGPGTFPGRPNTVMAITVTNRSAQALDLNQVVVTTQYGSPARVASPVYEASGLDDFAGKVPPGESASATYAFAIPAGQGGRVLTRVDFDGAHHAATFEGAVQ